MEKSPRQRLRLPDHITDEIGNTLRSKKKSMTFNEIFDAVFERMQQRNAVSGGEEMMRLRTYEKLQNMVNRGLVNKEGKEYSATKNLEEGVPQAKSGNKPPIIDIKSGKEKPLSQKLEDLAFAAVRDRGATYPTVAVSSDGTPTIVDTDNGKCYRIEVKAVLIR